MGDAFRKVRSGDKLKISARAYNAFIDLANMKSILPSAGRPRSTGSAATAQLTFYEIAETPDMVTLAGSYKLRPLNTPAWANGTTYAVDGLVTKTVDGVKKTYKCLVAHKAGGAGEWQAATPYAENDRVWNGTGPNATTYICTTATTGDVAFPAAKFTADGDDPEDGQAWDTYWVESYLAGYIYAPPYTGNIQEYAPLLVLDDPVLTILGKEETPLIWIISPGFIHIAMTAGDPAAIVQYSLWWNTTDRRLMSTFGG